MFADLNDLHDFCRETFYYIHEGAGRAAYDNPYQPGWVVKVPRNLATHETGGLGQQAYEISVLKRIAHLPFCPKFWVEYIPTKENFSIPVIHMEKVVPLTGDEKVTHLPWWCRYIHDGAQIGWTNKGGIVPYDLGYFVEVEDLVQAAAAQPL